MTTTSLKEKHGEIPGEIYAPRDEHGRLLPGAKLGIGNKGGGRIPKVSTQVALEATKHPDRVSILMERCFDMACNDDDPRVRLEALKYYVDRIKGKPKVTMGVEDEDRELLTAATVVEFYRLMRARESSTPLIGEFIEQTNGDEPDSVDLTAEP